MPADSTHHNDRVFGTSPDSSGKMLHQLREQAKGAKLKFLQCMSPELAHSGGYVCLLQCLLLGR
jgi:hypothetical protein